MVHCRTQRILTVLWKMRLTRKFSLEWAKATSKMQCTMLYVTDYYKQSSFKIKNYFSDNMTWSWRCSHGYYTVQQCSFVVEPSSAISHNTLTWSGVEVAYLKPEFGLLLWFHKELLHNMLPFQECQVALFWCKSLAFVEQNLEEKTFHICIPI